MNKMLEAEGVALKRFGYRHKFRLETINELAQSNPEYQVVTSEYGFNEYQPRHSLTLFREPTSHVVSQFFHCKESRDHRSQDRHLAMPKTLMEWLQGWRKLRKQNPNLERSFSNPFSHRSDAKYKCYNPLNFQSWLTKFPKSKQDLMARFEAVGIMEDMQKSLCLFLVQINERVPHHCNCTAETSTNYKGQELKSDHGVQHHGSSYTPTKQELRLIRQLTNLDRKLYHQAKQLFYEMVSRAEATYDVKLCGK